MKAEQKESQEKELEKLSIEEICGRLDEIMEHLEDGAVSLEDSFGYYETGMKLVKACSGKLDRVEKQIMVLKGQETEELR